LDAVVALKRQKMEMYNCSVRTLTMLNRQDDLRDWRMEHVELLTEWHDTDPSNWLCFMLETEYPLISPLDSNL
jgi:hypothetical protein